MGASDRSEGPCRIPTKVDDINPALSRIRNIP